MPNPGEDIHASSSSSGSGATMEKTNKRDVGGHGKKRRQQNDELEAVAAELAWQPAVRWP